VVIEGTQPSARDLLSMLSLELILDRDVLQPESRDRIREGLRGRKLVVIREAFHSAYAERMHTALDACRAWTPYEGSEGNFHCRHHNLYAKAAYPPELSECEAIFAAPDSRDLMTDLSGRDCSEMPEFSASWYMPSDYSLPHSDCSEELPGRQVAFLWHLSKDWKRSWGGHLYWGPTQNLLAPTFNTLILFAIDWPTSHFVAPVSLRASGKRLAVTGWWRGSTPYPSPAPTPQRNTDRIRLI
jgi:2-oxoglutarate-Fe(II)-dependent oxygenase superfamily protein